jgi:hypothetical protein
MMMRTDPEVLALLRLLVAGQQELRDAQREILTELRGLRTSLAAHPQDLHADLAGHLRTVSAVVEGRAFSVRELLAHAAIPEGEALRSAILGMIGTLNGRRLGKFLRRIEGQDIGGLSVERIGGDRDGAVWRLLRV